MYYRNYFASLIIIGIVFFLSCKEEEEAAIITPETDSLAISNLNLKGYVQKGPFINGTAITVSELDKKLTATGKNFNTQIIDNKGSFSIKNISLKSEYVQLMTDGFYFDEVKGEKSAAQLTMYALANVEDISSVNVNLLSHLEKERVIYLIQEEEKSFAEAKKQAQREILAIFGIVKEDIAPAELLDISQEGEDNAILLAISAILQADHTVAELSELLANIIADIREDGKLDSESSKEKIRQQTMSLNLSKIRTHLVKRYEELGVSATIANFEKYIDSDGDGILNKDEDDTPDEFAFTTQKDVAVSTEITSDEVTIAGLKAGGASDVYVSNASLFINGTAITDTIAQVKNGDKIKLQLTSSSQYADTVVAILTVGYLTSYFTVITDDYKADSFSFTAQKDVAVDSFYISNTITVSSLPYLTPASIENGILIKNGVEIQTDTTSVKSGDQLAIKLLSSDQYFSKTSAELNINGVSAAFDITTDDYKPDDFSFTAVENAKPDSVYTSKTITLAGLPYPTPISLIQDIAEGTLLINEEEVKDQNVTLQTGDRIAVKIKTSSEYSETIITTISIGSAKYVFKITTEPSPFHIIGRFPDEALVAGFAIENKMYMVGFSGGLYEYDSQTDLWTPKARFEGSGAFEGSYASIFILNGKGYIGSCNNKDFWEYNPAIDVWRQVATFPGGARNHEVNFTANGKAYVGLGKSESNGSYFTDIWQYDPEINAWTQKANFPGSGRTHAVALSFDNRAFIGGGKIETHLYDVWEYDATNDRWVQKNNIPKVLYITPSHISFCINNKGYAVNNQVGFSKYDPVTDTWSISVKYYDPYNVSFRLAAENKGCFVNPYNELVEFTPPQE